MLSDTIPIRFNRRMSRLFALNKRIFAENSLISVDKANFVSIIKHELFIGLGKLRDNAAEHHEATHSGIPPIIR